jgi:hypothetical protein
VHQLFFIARGVDCVSGIAGPRQVRRTTGRDYGNLIGVADSLGDRERAFVLDAVNLVLNQPGDFASSIKLTDILDSWFFLLEAESRRKKISA